MDESLVFIVENMRPLATLFSIACLYIPVVICYVVNSPNRDIKPCRGRSEIFAESRGQTIDLQSLGSSLVTHIAQGLSKTNDGEILIERPGFAYGMGKQEWSSSGYSGAILGWDSKKVVQWLSSQAISLISLDREVVDEMVVKPEAEAMLDLMLRGGAEHDAPHVIFKAKKPTGTASLKVLLDYVPRKDMIQDLSYFDKYFKDYKGPELDSMDCVDCTSAPNDFETTHSLITRVVRSPFAHEITIHGSNQERVAYELGCKHFDQWLRWTALPDEESGGKRKGVQVGSEETLMARIHRDNALHGLLVEEEKFRLARLFGADFAPDAAPIAEACVGPEYC
jgi:hypothetical protein